MPALLLQHVHGAPGTGPSSRRLNRALEAAGYAGPRVSFGWQGGSSKRRQLERLRDAGVPCPADAWGRPIFPKVARTENHRAGSGFWFCEGPGDEELARAQGATHSMQYLEGREFRVHVVDGLSIKLTEKLWSGTAREILNQDRVRSHQNGWHQMLPQPNARRVLLRDVAKRACEVLGLTLGAADVILNAEGAFVLEVNSAPALTSGTDTLDRYVAALMLRG